LRFDIEKVYLSGRGLSSLLAPLVPIQNAFVKAVRERDQAILVPDRSVAVGELSNGLRGLRIYAEEVVVSRLAGLTLRVPLTCQFIPG